MSTAPPQLDDAPATTDATARRRRTLALVAVAVLAVVAAALWYLTRPAPGAVSIDSAVGQLASGAESTAEDADTTATEAVGAAGTDGTWTVDTSVGEFSVEESSGTFVGFRIDEELANVGATTAVGRTPQVSGELTLDGTTLTEATFSADLTAVVSDQSRREDAIQRALDTAANPTADFALTEPVELAEVPRDSTTAATATGELTIAGVTQQVEVPLEFSVTDGVAVVTGTLDIVLADYGIEAPTAPIVVSVEDTATVELQLFLTQA